MKTCTEDTGDGQRWPTGGHMLKVTGRPAAASVQRTSSHRGVVLAAATLGFSMIQLDVSVVNVAIRPIGTALGGGVAGLQWVVDAYTLTFAALILAAGAAGDRRGAKRVLLGGFVVFSIGSAACGLVPGIGLLIAARAVQGVGAAALGACSLALLNHAFPDQGERARAVGTWATGGAAALAAGPVVGGLLIAGLGWRWIFFINLPLGAAGFWLTKRYATETPLARDRKVDLPGQLLAFAALAALAGATIEAGSAGFGAPVAIACCAVAVVAGTAFVLVERARTGPMLPLWLFRNETFSIAVAIGLLINVAFYGLIFALSLFLQRHEGLTPLAAGVAFLPATAAIMGSNVVAARTIPKLGFRKLIAGGAALMGAGCAVMVVLLSVHVAALVAALVVALAVAGFGIGLIAVPMTSALLGSVDPSWSGIASGTLTAFRQTGSVLGVALFGSLLAAMGATSGLRAACAGAVGLVLIVAALNYTAGRPAIRATSLRDR
jgi:MFS transporter, DHA2 family, methylenomycin A resistance protein